jgi:RimJ/RimL family protein N-acetyltransferase
MEVNFVAFDKKFLQMSNKWLQDEEIRMLIHASPFSAELQQQWFEQLPFRKNYLIWGVECDHNPIGVTGLKNVTATAAEYWGYIGEKKYWGRGIGKQMMQFIEAEAVHRKLSTIYLNVTKENERAISLYEKMGFQVIEKKQSLLYMEKQLRKSDD